MELRIEGRSIPVFPGALELHRSGTAVSQCGSNRVNVGDALAIENDFDAAEIDLLFDPQTSGGLLIALPPDEAGPLVAELRASGAARDAAVVGEVRSAARPGLRIV